MATAIYSTLQAAEILTTATLLLPYRFFKYVTSARYSTNSPPRVHKRKRRLSLPLDERRSLHTFLPGVHKKKQTTKPQHQSPLMNLPAELRVLIWTYVVVGGEEEGEFRMVRMCVERALARGVQSAEAQVFLGDWELHEACWRTGCVVARAEDGFWIRGVGVMGLLCSCRAV